MSSRPSPHTAPRLTLAACSREDQEAWLQVLDGFVKLINFWKHT